ncbi:MAG TPA: ATP-binding cassette domain-containing protein, partial [Euzebya sp.]|nr:ATP-binding cassette domain-containing protein [Euzebya sp.]
ERDVVASRGGGMGVVFQGVTVAVGGTTVLSEVDLDIGPGEHVAVVGASGAGKSSLLGVLLGWHEVRDGALRVDDQAVTAASVPGLREQIAWVEPGVQLWNRTLAENLTYGCDDADPDELVAAAGLQRVVHHLPGGVATRLGEGGALVSGGEGQRVRFGRGLGRGQARLVLLDEPFRGLDRTTRRELLDRARARWRHATILSVTHDVLDTTDVARVVVVHDGRVVEDGPPEVLRQRPDGVYARMLADAAEVDRMLWHDPGWRRWWLAEGQLAEGWDQP